MGKIRLLIADDHPLFLEGLCAVLRLMAEGKDNAGIAAALNLSEKTVRNYVSLTYDILGVSNRTQAVLWALGNGIVDSVDRDEPRRPE